MTLKQIVRLNFLVLIALVAAVMLDGKGDRPTTGPAARANATPPPTAGEVRRAARAEDTGTIKRVFLYCLIRTTFLYFYTIFCVYYVLLMEENQLLPRPFGFVGKMLIFTTIVGYLLVEVASPSDNAFVVFVRIGVVLVIFTLLHLMWWAFYSCTRVLTAETEKCCGKFKVLLDGETTQLLNDQEVPEEATTEL